MKLLRFSNSAVGAVCLIVANQAYASKAGSVSDGPPASAAAAATGTGEWQSRERGTATLPWQVEIEKFGDGAVLGWLRVLGSDYGKVQLVGRVDGNDVFGELLDAGGAQVGTFQGAVAGAGAAGTYSMHNGDDGNWTWPGVKAAEALTAGE